MTHAAASREASFPKERVELVRRGLWLNYATIVYNTIEAIVALIAGVMAGSVSLVSFGLDSAIEVTAAAAAQWRLRADVDPRRRARVEHVTLRLIGASFIALAIYVLIDSSKSLWLKERPESSISGIVILALSVVVMPLLARQKRAIGRQLVSRALQADAAQTSLCAYLSAIALAGVALNAFLGWWWADPVAALLMVPIIAKEGIEGLRGEDCCDTCA